MPTRRRLGAAAAAAILALTIAGCGGANVGSFAERGADLTTYHSYAWSSGDRLLTGDARLDGNPFFHRRVQSAVDRALASRGFVKAALTQPDLVLHYHATVERRFDVARDESTGAERRGRSVYEAGTLMIDLIDAHTGSLVWRGWAEGAIDGVIDNQEWMERTVDEAVSRIFAKLPERE